jgi:hypothetical protein
VVGATKMTYTIEVTNHGPRQNVDPIVVTANIAGNALFGLGPGSRAVHPVSPTDDSAVAAHRSPAGAFHAG